MLECSNGIHENSLNDRPLHGSRLGWMYTKLLALEYQLNKGWGTRGRAKNILKINNWEKGETIRENQVIQGISFLKKEKS